jgi:cytochrome d ubiquinol oxidase subunit II
MSTVGLSMFPFIVPSIMDYNSSLTVWDASSSYKALAVMLGTVVVFMPIVIFYVSFVYKVMFGKVTGDDIKKHSKELY